MNSLIYTTNTTPVAFDADTPVPLGNIVRRRGKNINSDGTGITVVGAGYYKVTVDAQVLTGAEGVATIRILQNGSELTRISESIGANGNGAINDTAIFRNFCYAPASTIEVFVAGTALPAMQRLEVIVEEV